MFLWICDCKNDNFVVYIIAATRGKAKKMYCDWYDGDTDYIEVRARKMKAADGFEPMVCDENCPTLEKLGVRYLTDEELAQLEMEE